jgi:hypothetical protein
VNRGEVKKKFRKARIEIENARKKIIRREKYFTRAGTISHKDASGWNKNHVSSCGTRDLRSASVSLAVSHASNTAHSAGETPTLQNRAGGFLQVVADDAVPFTEMQVRVLR